VTRQRLAQVGTLVVVAALGVAVALREPAQAPQPQDAIYRMLDAARAGDTSGYLSHYTGAMETSLRRTAAEQGEDAFAKYLRETNAAIKGVAVMDTELAAEGAVKLKVEYVYQDRNEVQTVHLVEVGKTWKIAQVEVAERVQTLIPYGTPVQ
jgi:hypothetical protein